MEVVSLETRLSVIVCRFIVPFYYKKETVELSKIAKAYRFNSESIASSLSKLTEAGILENRVDGESKEQNIILAKDPKCVTLYDVVNTIEGDKSAECCSDTLKCKSSKCENCGIYKVLQKVIDNRKKVLSATTLYEQYEKR